MKISDNTRAVTPATPFEYGQLGSLGLASYMLLCQYNFPAEYDPKKEELVSVDSDRLQASHGKEMGLAMMKFGTSGLMDFHSWAMRIDSETVHRFLTELLRPVYDGLTREDGTPYTWTGHRIMVTVHRGNGYPIFTFQLFARNEKGSTKVYTGSRAPNVKALAHA